MLLFIFYTENVNLLTTESLRELSDEGPFKKDIDWSLDVKSLQNLSMCSPKCIDKKNLHLYIKHLRLVDKNVSLWSVVITLNSKTKLSKLMNLHSIYYIVRALHVLLIS